VPLVSLGAAALRPELDAEGCGAVFVLAGAPALDVEGVFAAVVVLLCCGVDGVVAAASVLDVGLAVLHAAASASRHNPLGK
jgi:hypothetical protein